MLLHMFLLLKMVAPSETRLPTENTLASAAHPPIHPPILLTISGQSAGGSMAMNHLVAYSSSVKAAAIAAGSAYGCGALYGNGNPCWYGGMNIERSLSYIEQRFQEGLIDDPAHLKNLPVVLFNGEKDWTVYTKAMHDVASQLDSFGSSVTKHFDTKASHVWSLDHGNCNCGKCEYWKASIECCDVNNCNYDLSGDLLSKVYASLKPRTEATQPYVWVNQWKYLDKVLALHVEGIKRGNQTDVADVRDDKLDAQMNDTVVMTPARTLSQKRLRNMIRDRSNGLDLAPRKHGLLKWGLVYVPSACRMDVRQCTLHGGGIHVNYHGCIARKWTLREIWSSSLDLNEYAEANSMVVFYPQAGGDKKSGGGCWNWGFKKDDKYFDTQRSIQLGTVTAMVNDMHSALAQGCMLGNSTNECGRVMR